MNLNEGILWLALKDGDANALFSIYEIVHPDLVRNGRNITRDDDLIKDTINQFFLYLWDKRTTLSTPDNLKSYLTVSFRRKLIYEIKLGQRTISLAHPESEVLVEPSAEDVIIEDNNHLQLQLRIKAGIDKLPQRQKQLLMLKYYENYNYQEISEQTSLSVRTIYNNLHQAIKSLRKHFGE